MNVATIELSRHGLDPWTVDLDANGRPIVWAYGRAIPRMLPQWDDLIGVRVVQVFLPPDPPVPPRPTPPPPPGDSSSGCNAGFAMLAALALVPMIVRRRG